MAATLTHLVYHLVFSTKGRQPLITPEIRDDLHRYLGGIVKGEGGMVLQIGGMPDHVHLVIRLKPVHSLAEVMRKVKSGSSKWLNDQKRLPRKFAWQDGYGGFTVSESQVLAVLEYVREQERHHRRISFQDEYICILQRHGMEYEDTSLRG